MATVVGSAVPTPVVPSSRPRSNVTSGSGGTPRDEARKRHRTETPNGDAGLILPPVAKRDLELFAVEHTPLDVGIVASDEIRRLAATPTDQYAFVTEDPLERGGIFRFPVIRRVEPDANIAEPDADDAEGLTVEVRYYIYDRTTRLFRGFEGFSHDGYILEDADVGTTGVDYLIGRTALDRYSSVARSVARFVASDRERQRRRQRRE